MTDLALLVAETVAKLAQAPVPPWSSRGRAGSKPQRGHRPKLPGALQVPDTGVEEEAVGALDATPGAGVEEEAVKALDTHDHGEVRVGAEQEKGLARSRA